MLIGQRHFGFKKGSGTVVRSTLWAVPATVPDPFLNHANIPESQVCQELGIEIMPQIGGRKDRTSSGFLRDWGEFWRQSQA